MKLIIFLIIFFTTTPSIHSKTATCTLTADAPSTASGSVTITQTDSNSSIQISGTFTGVEPVNQSHGFHVHAQGLINPCTNAGGHYNPTNRDHGAPTNAQTARHVGDLGNVSANADGLVQVVISDPIASLYTENNRYSIIGKALVLHQGADDFTTQPTGAAGSRLACCVVVEGGLFGKFVSYMVSGLVVAGLMLSI